MSKSLQIKVDNGTQIACICPQVACNLLCGDWSPHGSPRSVYLKKNIKMSNFAPCGPIFKIRNSKLVYSKSYKQITDYIFLITSTFRLLLYYYVHFYTQRNRIWKNQHCCPTVHWGDYCCIFIWLFVPNFQFPQPVPSAAQLIPLQASLILFLPLHNVLCLMTCFFLWRVLLVLGRKLIFLEVRCQDSCFDLDAV